VGIARETRPRLLVNDVVLQRDGAVKRPGIFYVSGPNRTENILAMLDQPR
jgi:hypothetical protein